MATATARACHAGDGDRQLDGGVAQRAFGHRAHHGLTHRAVARDQLGGDAQQLRLGGVAVGDEAAFKPIAAARQVGAGAGNQPAGAAFGGDQPLLPRTQALRQFFNQIGLQPYSILRDQLCC